MLNSSIRSKAHAVRFLLAVLGVVALLLMQARPSAEAAPRQVTGGALNWGIKASFRTYITGPIAHGAISVAGGASQNPDGSYRFPVLSGSYDNAGSTTVSFGGSVHFTGHTGQLDMTVSNPRLQIAGGAATLVADITSLALNTTTPQSFPSVALASLTVAAPVDSGTTVTWSNLPAAITAAGATPFGGFYTAGTVMDPATISLTTAAPAVAATSTSIPALPTATPFQAFFQPTATPPAFVPLLPTPTIFVPQANVNTQVFTASTPIPSSANSSAAGRTTTTTTTTSAPASQQQPTSSVLGATTQSAPVRPPVTGDGGLIREE